MDRRRGNIVVSRRTVLEETRASSARNWCRTSRGQVIDGVVKNITITVRSSTSAASTACCTYRIACAGSITRPRF